MKTSGLVLINAPIADAQPFHFSFTIMNITRNPYHMGIWMCIYLNGYIYVYIMYVFNSEVVNINITYISFQKM